MASHEPHYVTEPLTFNQLNFCQFVGGECRTILKTESETEQIGRLRVLSKVAYLHDQCKSWDRAQAAYFAIISSIEEGEAQWSSSFGHYDLMCPAPSGDTAEKCSNKSITLARPKQLGKRDFFCKEFQKGECRQGAPHKGWIHNSMEMVDHFCAVCFRAKLGKHPLSQVRKHVQKSDHYRMMDTSLIQKHLFQKRYG